jgi:hypothetical protein
MIKFFRKIRYDLMEKNNTVQYFKYAIGEIILVVFGILIALSLNNWSETRKNNAEEQKIILSLNTEFRINLKKLDTIILNIEKRLKDMDRILNIMNNTITIGDNPATFDRLLISMISNPSYFPSSIVLKELKSSGKLAKFKDPDLKELLYDWNTMQDKLLVTIDISNNSSKNCIDYIKANGSLRRIDFLAEQRVTQTILSQSNLHLLSDLKFENVLDDHVMLLSARNSNNKRAAKLLKLIIASTDPINNN